MKNYYNLSWKSVIDELDGDDIKGITDEESEIRRDVYGDNYVSYGTGRSRLKGALTLVVSPWALVLLIMISISFYCGNDIAAFYFFIIFIGTGAVLLWNKREPMKIRKHLDNLNKSSAVVLRNGEKTRVPMGELVVGDVVYIQKGAFVPADMRLISAENLFVNELAVTGEDYPTEKFEEKIDENNPSITSMKNMVFRSTVVTKGRGIGVVVETGMKSEIGKLIGSVFMKDESYKKEFSTEGGINAVSVTVLFFSMILCGLRFLKGNGDIALQSMVNDMVLMNVTFLGISYLIGVYRSIRLLKNRGININDEGVLYRLRDVDTYILDKYELLTSEFYYVGGVFVDDQYMTVREIEVSDDSYDKLKKLNEITTRCCEFFDEEEYPHKNKMLKTEYSLLRFVFNIDKSMIHEKTKHNEVFTIPFDRDRNIKTVVSKMEEGAYRAYSIGEIDKILNMSVSRLMDGSEVSLTSEEREKIKKASYKMARSGCRIVAAGYRNYNYMPSAEENIESNYVFVGLWGIRESYEDECVDVFRKLNESDIEFLLNCDENKVAATNIGRELGMIEEGVTAVSGLEMDYITKTERMKLLNTCNVYSRINSKQKADFTEILKSQGKKIVGFGHRLKDISYLHKCDIRVSYGDSTSEILKSWSDVYMERGNFKDILKVIGCGNKCREKFRSLREYTMFIMGFLMFLALFNVFNDISFTGLSSALGVIGVMMSSMMILFGDIKKEERKREQQDRRGHYLGAGVIVGVLSAFGVFLGSKGNILSMESGLRLIGVIVPALSFMSICSFRELLNKFGFFMMFLGELFIVGILIFLHPTRVLLGLVSSIGGTQVAFIFLLSLWAVAFGNFAIKSMIKK